MITGRIEEWWKKICIKHDCKYYIHEDYPKCSYCTYPNNCILMDKLQESKDAQSTHNDFLTKKFNIPIESEEE